MLFFNATLQGKKKDGFHSSAFYAFGLQIRVSDVGAENEKC